MIPKIIHYCWFGGSPLPSSVNKCIASWNKLCPDYEIIRWDESNFDVNCCRYVKEAYYAKMWAFVSDYARLKIIYDNGGIYLDTDVELIRPLDELLNDDCFLAIEKDTNDLTDEASIFVATGLGFGAVKHNSIVQSMLNEYTDVPFITNGNLDLTPCPIRNTNVLFKYGFKQIDILQDLECVKIYPSEYFCPNEYSSKVNNFSDKTISIHHYSASWKSANQLRSEKVIRKIKTILGVYLVKKLSCLKSALKDNNI